MQTITGRVVGTQHKSTSRNGNPRYTVTIDTSPDIPGHYGAERTTDRYAENAKHCYTCRRTFTAGTPANRCPWEDMHDMQTQVTTAPDSGLAYGIDNPEYRDDYHVFTLYANGSIRSVAPVA